MIKDAPPISTRNISIEDAVRNLEAYIDSNMPSQCDIEPYSVTWTQRSAAKSSLHAMVKPHRLEIIKVKVRVKPIEIWIEQSELLP